MVRVPAAAGRLGREEQCAAQIAGDWTFQDPTARAAWGLPFGTGPFCLRDSLAARLSSP